MRRLFALVFFAAACTPVRPWQREALAPRCMRASPRPARDASHSHVFIPREGTRPGGVVGGGGCGCD